MFLELTADNSRLEQRLGEQSSPQVRVASGSRLSSIIAREGGSVNMGRGARPATRTTYSTKVSSSLQGWRG